MPSCATIGCVNRSGKNPSLSFHQIPSYQRKEIRQEWLRRTKCGQNEKYLPRDSTFAKSILKKIIWKEICKFYQFLKRICKNIHRNKPS